MTENRLVQGEAVKGLIVGLLAWMVGFFGAAFASSLYYFLICFYGLATLGWSFSIVWGIDSFRKLNKEDKKYRRIALVSMALGLSFVLFCVIAIVNSILFSGSWSL